MIICMTKHDLQKEETKDQKPEGTAASCKNEDKQCEEDEFEAFLDKQE